MSAAESFFDHPEVTREEVLERQLGDLRALLTFIIRTRSRNCLGIVREDWKAIVDKAAELGVRL